jgi:hypothetical protein
MAVPLTQDVPPPPKIMCLGSRKRIRTILGAFLKCSGRLGSVGTFHHSTAIIYRKIKFLANESRYDFFIQKGTVDWKKWTSFELARVDQFSLDKNI